MIQNVVSYPAGVARTELSASRKGQEAGAQKLRLWTLHGACAEVGHAFALKGQHKIAQGKAKRRPGKNETSPSINTL